MFTLDPRDRTPIYAQLEQGIRAAIATGRLASGEQLPTVRQLAVELRINANTVARVYGDLERVRGARDQAWRGLVRQQHAGSSSAETGQRPTAEHFVTRVLADAAAAGFTAQELLDALANRAKGD